MSESRLEPKLVSVLREGYTKALFAKDLGAGLVVGVVALPLALAFAIASGVKPEQGLFTAIVGGLIIAALSGSRVQIGGPTGAFVVVVAGIVGQYGIDGLFMCTLMAGVILMVMGLTGTGTAVKYIPRPVVIGFTNGIALVIISTQLRDFLGLTIDVPGETRDGDRRVYMLRIDRETKQLRVDPKFRDVAPRVVKNAKDVDVFDIDGITVGRGRQARSAGGHVDELETRAVRAKGRAQDLPLPALVVGSQDRRTRSVAEEDAGLALLVVGDRRERVRADHERVGEGARELVAHRQAINEVRHLVVRTARVNRAVGVLRKTRERDQDGLDAPAPD